MSKQLNIFPSIICDVCSKPIHSDGFMFEGFFCADTKMVVHTDCKNEFYRMKQGDDYATTYSEMPLTLHFNFYHVKKELI